MINAKYVKPLPAARCVKAFGGLSKAAAALSKPRTTVQRWLESGFIPAKYNELILSAALAGGIQLDIGCFTDVDPSHPAFLPVSDRRRRRVAA